MYDRLLAFFGFSSLSAILSSFEKTIARLELHQKMKLQEQEQHLANADYLTRQADSAKADAATAVAEATRAAAIKAKIADIIK